MDKSTPIKTSFKLKPGVIAVHKKWVNSQLFHELKSLFNGVLVDDLGDIDFCISSQTSVCYIVESRLILGVPNIQRDVIYIADRNPLSLAKYSEFQDKCLLNGCQLLPIGTITELPLILRQLHQAEVSTTPNSKLKESISSDLHIKLLQHIPGLGRTKAEKLLNHFGTMQNIVYATEKELTPLVGLSSALHTYHFFRS